MLTYITSATDVSNEELVHSLETTVPEKEETLMTTLAKQWIEEGIEAGKKLGIEQGIEQGRQALMDTLHYGVKSRFDSEEETLMAQIMTIKDIAKLQQMITTLFEVKYFGRVSAPMLEHHG